LTSKFGQVLPIDWKHTYIRSRFLSSLLGAYQQKQRFKPKCLKGACSRSQSTYDLESEEDRLVSQACNYLSYLDSIHRSPSDPLTPSDCCSDCEPIDSIEPSTPYHRSSEEIDEDEQLAKDLDFHCLILCSAQATGNTFGKPCRIDADRIDDDGEPPSIEQSLPFTAEQVLTEIDALMQDDALPAEHEQLADQLNALGLSSMAMQSSESSDCITLDSGLPESTLMTDSLCLPSGDPAIGSVSTSVSSISLSSDLTFSRSAVSGNSSAPIDSSGLKDLTICQLNELYLDLERAIQQLSEVLIQQLALRDELEYEKEQKNSFISLLLAIQTKRRKQNLQRKGVGRSTEGGKHLSTVIPYPCNAGPPDLPTLQVLIKSTFVIIVFDFH
jgi:hypothetical protein